MSLQGLTDYGSCSKTPAMNDKIEVGDILPEVPKITEEQLESARKSGRYESIVFEEYKFTAQLVAIVARIDKNSEGFKKIPSQHYHVLMGLMNRCARLILGTMELSHKGKFGETSAIIFRCIFESGVKIIWLSTDVSQDKFDLYINDSLRPEIELLDTIQVNIKKRGDGATVLEKRMTDSVMRHIKLAETTKKAIRETKKMPDMASLVRDIGLDRIMYLANHRMGSHHVHGTWPSLLFSYLEEDNGELVARGNDVSTRANEFIATSLIMTKAMHSYCDYLLESPVKEILINLFIEEEKTLLSIHKDIDQNGW